MCDTEGRTGYGWMGIIVAILVIVIIIIIIAVIFRAFWGTGSNGRRPGGAPGYTPGGIAQGPAVIQYTPSGTNYCAQFSSPCIPPEPYASSVDITTASQNLEAAIHAPNKNDMISNLDDARRQLINAHKYFADNGYTLKADRVQGVIDEFDGVYGQAIAINGKGFADFKSKTLYGFMGVLAALKADIYR